MNRPKLDKKSLDYVRAQARRRAWIVPGAGLAMLGYHTVGAAIALPLAAAIVALGCLALAPSPLWLWTFLVAAFLALCGSIVESRALRRIPPTVDPREKPRRWFTVTWMVLVAAVLVDGWLVFRYVGWFQVNDAGMDPTIRPGDYLLFSRFGDKDDLTHGSVVAYRTPPNSPVQSENGLAIGRILAVADDTIAISQDGRRYVVNGRRTNVAPAQHGRGAAEFAVPRMPGPPARIPFKEYFIAADDPKLGYDSRAIGLVRRDRIISGRMLRFGKGGFGTGLEAVDLLASEDSVESARDNVAPQVNRPLANDAARLKHRITAAATAGTTFLLNKQTENGAWISETYGSFKDGASLTPMIALALAECDSVSSSPAARRGAERAVEYLASLTGGEGGVKGAAESVTYPVYTAALSVILLSRPQQVSDDKLRTARAAWLKHLRSLQMTEDLGWTMDDAWYGGWGYSTDIPKKPEDGKSPPLDEPNLSATVFALEAIRSAGIGADDPAVQKAKQFVFRCQNYREAGNGTSEKPNRESGEDNETDDTRGSESSVADGGFFFLQHDFERNKAGFADDQPKQPEAADARRRYRSYGSTTADGLRCLLLCGLPKEHPRVAAAADWLETRFAADRQPGDFPAERTAWREALYFYYVHSAANVLADLNVRRRKPSSAANGSLAVGWAKKLAEELLRRQNTDGSWQNRENLNREDDPMLATALALRTLALCLERL